MERALRHRRVRVEGRPQRLPGGRDRGSAPGRALDLACGEGRNAVWLAEQGWDATGVDFSDAGLDKGRRLAADRGVEVEWVCADATSWDPPADGYDLVAVFYLQLPADGRRRAMGIAGRALAPNGTLLVVAHDSANLTDGVGGPQDPAVLYTPDDVLADLARRRDRRHRRAGRDGRTLRRRRRSPGARLPGAGPPLSDGRSGHRVTVPRCSSALQARTPNAFAASDWGIGTGPVGPSSPLDGVDRPGRDARRRPTPRCRCRRGSPPAGRPGRPATTHG